LHDAFENTFALAAEWLVFLSLFLAMIGRLDPDQFEGDNGNLIGIVLFAFTVGFVVVAIVFVNLEAARAVLVLVSGSTTPGLETWEWAIGFGRIKFTTTLTSVVSNNVGSDKVLVYLWCSLASAHQMRSAGGIPVLSDCGIGHKVKARGMGVFVEEVSTDEATEGIALSLRGPHDLEDDCDPELVLLLAPTFSDPANPPLCRREVVMALSVPRMLLRPLPNASGQPSSLWYIPSELVRTLGGWEPTLGDSVRSGTFPETSLLLPGSTVQRIFQLADETDPRAFSYTLPLPATPASAIALLGSSTNFLDHNRKQRARTSTVGTGASVLEGLKRWRVRSRGQFGSEQMVERNRTPTLLSTLSALDITNAKDRSSAAAPSTQTLAVLTVDPFAFSVAMNKVRAQCTERNLQVLYHYTEPR
jgi:hypothetical protein